MPQRSNDFQKLFARLEAQLTPAGVTVRESVMLSPADGGKDREVDILLEGKMGQHNVRIALECRDQKRKQSIAWIDELHGKYRDIQVDKVVAVSSSGFSAEAKRRAKLLNYDAIHLQQALDAEWVNVCARYVFVLFCWNHSLVGARLEYGDTETSRNDDEDLLNCKIADRDGCVLSTVERDGRHLYRQHIQEALDEWSSENMLAIWQRGEGYEHEFPILFEVSDRFVIWADGFKRELRRVTLRVKCHFELHTGPSSYYSYNGTKAADGKVTTTEKNYNYTMIFDDANRPARLSVQELPEPKVVNRKRK